MQKIDFGKLFGFETVAGCDFLDETFGAKLGAKVGNLHQLPQVRHWLAVLITLLPGILLAE